MRKFAKGLIVYERRGNKSSETTPRRAFTLLRISVLRWRWHALITGIPERTGPRKAQENEVAPEPKATK
jgi:hypothetical protein